MDNGRRELRTGTRRVEIGERVESSFDVVSKVDRQEVDERTRPGPVASSPSASTSRTPRARTSRGGGEKIEMRAEHRGAGQGRARRLQGQADQARDLARDAGRPPNRRSPATRKYKISAEVTEGIQPGQREEGRQAESRTRGRRASRPRSRGDELRVSSKSRDTRPARKVIALLKGQDFEFAVQDSRTTGRDR